MIAILRQILIMLSSSAKCNFSRNGMLPRRLSAFAACCILLGTVGALALGQASHADTTLPPTVAAMSFSQDSPRPDFGVPLQVTTKQRKAILKSNFEKIKKDTDELAALAKSLQEEVGKSNENVLSLKIVEKAEKIENLAKKIKNSAKEG
jgi:hypothetical protein